MTTDIDVRPVFETKEIEISFVHAGVTRRLTVLEAVELIQQLLGALVTVLEALEVERLP